MAEPVKRGKKYRITVMINGVRRGGTFDSKKEARDWEHGIRYMAKHTPDAPILRERHKLTDACDRYLRTVTPSKRDSAEKWESARFNLLIAKFPGKCIEDLTSDMLSLWKEELLKSVSGSTVNRYFNLYNNLFSVAKSEWRWLKENPLTGVKRPKENLPRSQVWKWQQIKAILREGQLRGGKYGEVTLAFHIALRTGMRLQEALAAPLGFDKLSKTILIKKRKESLLPERIPLTGQAYRLMLKMRPFVVEANEASVLFSDLKRQIGINGLEFRDSRATALTLMSKKMDIKTLRRISRHRDVNLLLDVYYRETAEEISSRLR